MDLKGMRRACAALVDELDIPIPVEPDHLVACLCERMGQRLGRPVHHRLVRFPPGTLSGVWVATEHANYLLCEEDTSGWHRLAITAHEFWHMETDHDQTAVAGSDADRLSLPSLDPQTVARIMAARTHYAAIAEQEAELFASILLTKVSRWLPRQDWVVPGHAMGLVDRLEATLGNASGRDNHG
jgi:hypothetical protein